MIKESQPRDINPAPAEYDYDNENIHHPFRVRLNPNELGSLLSSEFGMNPDQIRKLRFTISDKMEDTLTFTISSRGPSVSQTHTMGTAELARDRDGFRPVRISLGSIYITHENKKEAALDYSVLSKQGELPPSLANHRSAAERSLAFTFRTKKMPSYLKQVDWQRANAFLDKLLSRSFSDAVLNVVVHESSHLRDYIDIDDAKASYSSDVKKGQKAAILAAAGVAGFIGEKAAGVPFPFDYIPILVSGVAEVGSMLFIVRMKKNLKRFQKSVNDTEEKAREVAESTNLSKWAKVLELEPNPNYIGKT